MNFNEIAEKKQEEEQKKKLTMLEEQSMKARMEYENTLLKESLEKSTSDYTKLNKGLEETQKRVESKVEELKKSNEMIDNNLKETTSNLKEHLEKELLTLNDRVGKNIESNLNQTTTMTEDFISELKEYIEELRLLQAKAGRRYNNYYNRKNLYIILLPFTSGLVSGVVFYILYRLL